MKTIELNSAENIIVAIIFEPKVFNGRLILMNSATGAKQTYFKHFANYLCERGFRVITYDYSGIGLSAPKSLRGYKTSMMQWGTTDLTTMLDYIAENQIYDKLILIGQSVGGQIYGLSPTIHHADGFVNVAAQSGYFGMWRFPGSLFILLNWFNMTLLTRLVGYFPGKRLRIVGNLPKGVALDWSKWGRSKEYFFDHFDNAAEIYARLNVPLLSYSFSDDTTAPIDNVKWMNAKYKNCPLTHKHYKPSDINVKSIGHFGFFRPKCQVLWDDLIEEVLKF